MYEKEKMSATVIIERMEARRTELLLFLEISS
jgi:hypothetical protein